MAASRASTRARGASLSTATDKDSKDRAAELSKKMLDDFASVGKPSASMRVVVHGGNGVGKTTFLAHCPGVFFLAIEDGANQHRVPQWRAKITSADELERAVDALRFSKHEYKAVAVETLDAVEELLKARVEARLRETAQKDSPVTIGELNEREYGAGYDLLRDEWRFLLQRLDALREEKGMHVLLSAHSKIDTVKNLTGSDHQRYTLQVDGKKCANVITGWSDYVLFFAEEVAMVSDGDVRKGKGKMLAVSGDRIMHCVQSATVDAKCRGEIPWPEKLPLDEADGWTTFAETARLIREHGKDLVTWLESEVNRILPTIRDNGMFKAEERRKMAKTIFVRAMGEKQYYQAWRVIEHADKDNVKDNGVSSTLQFVDDTKYSAETETTEQAGQG